MGGLAGPTLLAFKESMCRGSAPGFIAREESTASATIVPGGRIPHKKQPDLVGLALRASQIVASWQLRANGTGHGRKDVI